MEERRHRELFWPLMLIVVGVILLLQQLGIWEFSWARLWRLWPLLLILIGLDIILSRSRVGSVIFLILATALIVLAVLFVPGPLGNGRGGADQQTFDYPARGLERATIYLDVGVGQLDMYPLEDSGKLFEADVSYNSSRTRVTSDLEVDDDEATVRLETRSTGGGWAPFGNQSDNMWEVGLNTSIPMTLNVAGGVNKTSLDLDGMTLQEVRLEIGVGKAELVLSEKAPYKVEIEGGVGKLNMSVPPGLQVRIRVDGGLGSIDLDERFQRRGDYYVTPEYQEGEGVEIEIDGGIGSIEIE